MDVSALSDHATIVEKVNLREVVWYDNISGALSKYFDGESVHSNPKPMCILIYKE